MNEITKQIETYLKKLKNQETSKIGRPASLISKRKVTFDISEELIAQIDKCANYLGTTRAAFCAQAVMWKVREMQKTENLKNA